MRTNLFQLSVYFIRRNSVCSLDLSCHAWALISGISIAIASTASTGDAFHSALTVKNDPRFTALLTLRVTALYRKVRWAVWFLWLAFALFQGLRAITFLFGAALSFSTVAFSQLYNQTDFMYADEVEYSPISHMCEVGNLANRSTGFLAIAPIPFDLLLLVLTTSKVMRSSTSLKSNTIVRVEFWLSPCRILR